MRARDFVKSNVAYHKELNPVAWTNGRLRPEVRRHLAKVAQVFERYLEIPGFKVHDVVLTGSMANYNYTKYSDFDLHIITDYTDLECDDLAEAFYRAKKQIWNDAHDITIRGHEIECYIEDIAQPPVSGGVYSILQDIWIKQPSYDPPRINNTAVNLKTRDLVKQINSVIKERDVGAMEQLKDKLRRMRRSGLDTEGEFGVENLSFKILRNMGYIDRLHRATVDQQDVELSLQENQSNNFLWMVL
jgi:predicted nucleotidyltransferase